MKSVKPGRGPSFMGGIGSIFVGLFGIGWTITASSMGAPLLFTLFGIGFVILAVVQAVYNFINATGKKRFSTFDITGDSEEPDPLNERFGQAQDPPQEAMDGETAFCPYCGTPAASGHLYCKKCGKKL